MAQITPMGNSLTGNPKMTSLEKSVLLNIVMCDYQDASELNDTIDHSVWGWCATNGDKKLSGVLCSCIVKGFVQSNGDKGKESTLWITELGVEKLKEDGVELYNGKIVNHTVITPTQQVEINKLASVNRAVNELMLAAEHNGMTIEEMGELVTDMAKRKLDKTQKTTK